MNTYQNPSSAKVETSPIAVHLPSWNRYINQSIAKEISTLSRYYDRVIQWMPRSEDTRFLLNQIQSPRKEICAESSIPDLTQERSLRTVILLNGNLNYNLDIQDLLTQLKTKLSRTSRVVAVAYNPYLSWLYRLVNFLGLRKAELPSTFITRADLTNIAKLAGFEVVRMRQTVYFPWRWLGLGTVFNRAMELIPGIRRFSLAAVLVLRPIISEKPDERPSLSVIIPARNEKGNIENALKRMPHFCKDLEIVFVEGHSNDGTWEEIQRILPLYSDRFKLKAFRQTGKGKGDAVRLGFREASGELVTILDADLTMPPELLGRFYESYCQGLADFINGTRLVYPMEGEAMRFLNRLGNIFFAKALSQVLELSLGDSLCGTKLLSKHDYNRMTAWRKDFGDFDPFGDFELIFPAAILALGVLDIPIRYKARTYGTTNISRFKHGWMLLKMTWVGLCKVRLGI